MREMWAMKTPSNRYLQSLKAEPFLGEDRAYYRGVLEQQHPGYNFSLVDDTTLMNIYDSLEHEQAEMINEIFK